MNQEQELNIDFKNLCAHLGDGVYFADPKGIILYVNRSFASLLGYREPSDIVGRSFLEFLDASDVEKIIKIPSEDTFTTMRLEVQFFRLDGSKVWAEIHPTLKFPTSHLEGTFGTVRDITEFKRLEERLQNLAITDELTGLYNRRGFRLMAEQELKHAQRLNTEVILLCLDVDSFKSINDSFGHGEGDKVLKLVARTLQQSFRETDIIARWGGDEFVVLALDAPVGYVPLLSDRFQTNLARNAEELNLSYPVKMTIGMDSTAVFEDNTLSTLLSKADQRMYQKKRYIN